MRIRPTKYAVIGALGPILLLSDCAGTPHGCIAEYAANVRAIQAAGQTREAFLAACVAGTEKHPYTRPDPAASAAPGR